MLIAEAYWDTEWTLQQQGFAFCYDKRLYDRILEQDPPEVRGHLQADLGYQSRLLRFLENHDEPRIADKLPADLERAAAVTIATLPGATLWHEGQFEGRKVRIPVFLARLPTSRPTRNWRPGTAPCCTGSPTTPCGRGPGSCCKPKAGRTTSPPATWSPGRGRTSRRTPMASAGT